MLLKHKIDLTSDLKQTIKSNQKFNSWTFLYHFASFSDSSWKQNYISESKVVYLIIYYYHVTILIIIVDVFFTEI